MALAASRLTRAPMLFSMGATEDAAWRRSAAAESDGFIAGRCTT
jgi:hypothetical protein